MFNFIFFMHFPFIHNIKYKSGWFVWLFCRVYDSKCIIPMEFYTFQNNGASSLLPFIRASHSLFLFHVCSSSSSLYPTFFFAHKRTHIHIHSHQTTVVQYRMMVIAWKVVEYKYKTHFRLIKIVLTRNSHSSCK